MEKKIFTTMAAALVSAAALAQAPAFPGAEGHGRYVTGGRGGRVVHVTNLNDSGTGSFREAVKSGKRIIVFDVAGVIALKSDLKIADNITILGQTAPSPGITLRYYTVQPGSNNIIRFLRIRRGQEKNINDGADATWQRNKTGIIFDHCSFSWASTRWLRSTTTTISPCSGVPLPRVSPIRVTQRVPMVTEVFGEESSPASTTTFWVI